MAAEGVTLFLSTARMQNQDQIMPLPDRSRAIIFGSLLGDGSLKIHAPYINARFSFRHSVHQEEYFFWKVHELAQIASERCVWRQGKDGKDGFGGEKLRFQSLALPSLTEFYHLTHKRGVFRIRRKWLNLLTPLSLAVWWLDDGSLVSDTRQGVICTDGFSLDQVRILDRYMKKVWGVSTSVGQVSRREQYRLWIRSTENLQKFLRIILPYIPVPSMLPKVLMLYKDPTLQQRWTSEVVQLSPFSQDVVQHYLELKRQKWQQFRG